MKHFATGRRLYVIVGRAFHPNGRLVYEQEFEFDLGENNAHLPESVLRATLFSEAEGLLREKGSHLFRGYTPMTFSLVDA